MIRLERLAMVRLTPEGAEFNRFSTQIVHIAALPNGPTFYNTATNTHSTTIPNAIVIATSTTRIYQDPSDPPKVVRCASDNGTHPARYIREPVDDLCPICSNYGGQCIATTPVLIASREGSGWRVVRLDLTGENAKLARTWEQTYYVDWNLEHEADITIALDDKRTVGLQLGEPRRMSRRQEHEFLELWRLLQHVPLYSAMLKPVQP